MRCWMSSLRSCVARSNSLEYLLPALNSTALRTARNTSAVACFGLRLLSTPTVQRTCPATSRNGCGSSSLANAAWSLALGMCEKTRTVWSSASEPARSLKAWKWRRLSSVKRPYPSMKRKTLTPKAEVEASSSNLCLFSSSLKLWLRKPHCQSSSMRLLRNPTVSTTRSGMPSRTTSQCDASEVPELKPSDSTKNCRPAMRLHKVLFPAPVTPTQTTVMRFSSFNETLAPINGAAQPKIDPCC
mmetsp:Transcript_49257/g.157558  ORF Transcript_49257/g.157558 Transcript_49257/m.157558 type:complete len:243 (+) Transcript_49257:250-978(+)